MLDLLGILYTIVILIIGFSVFCVAVYLTVITKSVLGLMPLALFILILFMIDKYKR